MLLRETVRHALAGDPALLVKMAGHHPPLAHRVREEAARAGTAPERLMAAMVRDFIADDPGRRWRQLAGEVHGQADPGSALLAGILRRRMDQRTDRRTDGEDGRQGSGGAG